MALPGLAAVRGRIADGCLVGLALCALPALAVSLWRILDVGWLDVMALHIGLVAVVAAAAVRRRHLPLWARGAVLVGIIYAMGTGSLATFGASGEALLMFVGVSLMTCLLAGMTAGILATLGCVASWGLGYYALRTGMLSVPVDLNTYLLLPSAWALKLVAFVLLVAIVTASIQVYNSALVAALKRSRDEQRQLREMAGDLQRARDAAVAASHAKSHFLAGVSHELRTPLNAILGFSEFLMLYGEKVATEKATGYVRDIHNSGRFLLDMIDDLLDLSRIEAGVQTLSEEDTDLAALVREAMRTLSPMAAKTRATLHSRGLDAALFVRADRRMLVEIVHNLLGNAVKFGTDGLVSVELDRDDDGDVLLAISDSGIGVEPEIIPLLFEPFGQASETTARRFGGTGLGLSIARRLARLHDGDITMESAPEDGTTLRVRLPGSRFVPTPARLSQVAAASQAA
jgi:two-component system cell cycle sensor histidine kinase PleC